MPGSKHHIRWMIRRDLPEVVAIESTTVSPWSEADFLQCLRQRNYVGLVLVSGDLIDGYAIYSLHKSTIRIENLAVASWARRQHLGTTLVMRLLAKLVAHRRKQIEVAVRETNMPAIKLFSSCGFRAVGVDRGRFTEPDEDGYRMVMTAEMVDRFATRKLRAVA